MSILDDLVAEHEEKLEQLKNGCADGAGRPAANAIEELGKDGDFFRNNYAALLAQYPNQWIAIKWQRVVGAAASYFEMVAQLKEKGIACNETLWEYMTENREILIASLWDMDDD